MKEMCLKWSLQFEVLAGEGQSQILVVSATVSAAVSAATSQDRLWVPMFQLHSHSNLLPTLIDQTAEIGTEG